MTPRRTVRLKERASREVRLAAADVAHLLASHRPHLEVAPPGRRGLYRLTPAGYVGTILCPRSRLVIRPKVPLPNLCHLLDPKCVSPAASDQTTKVGAADLLDLLAAQLARLMEERVAAGLHRAYAEQTTQGPFLQGRLDVTAHLRDPHGRKNQFHCRYEDFTPDLPCNQVPRATLELLLRCPLLGQAVRPTLEHALQAFTGVSAVPLGPELFVAAEPTPLTECYRRLLNLCWLLADGLRPGETAGPWSWPAFLLNMEQVFERYVTTGLIAAFPPGARYEAVAQALYRANEPGAGQPEVWLRPDITVNAGGRPIVVVDAKWKRLQDSPLVTEDIYQVLAYCTALGAQRAVLVYPGRRDRLWIYRLGPSPVQLQIRTLRVVGSRAALDRSVAKFVRAVRPVRSELPCRRP